MQLNYDCNDVMESRSAHDIKCSSCDACAADGEVVPDNKALTEDELIDKVTREVMQRYKPAFQELAK